MPSQRPIQRSFNLDGFATDFKTVLVTALADDTDDVPNGWVCPEWRVSGGGNVAVRTLDGDAARVIAVEDNEWISGVLVTGFDATSTTATGTITMKMAKV